jgi:protein-S-isoprenylcysteine O-methyltransferase Ste14
MILFDFLLRWPTLVTLAMFPVLVVTHGRLAASEGAEMRQRFGATYEQWAARTPRLVPTGRDRRAIG